MQTHRIIGQLIYSRAAAALALLLLFSGGLAAQDTRPLIDVQAYDIDAVADPASQTLQAKATVRFIAREPVTEAIFELHNGLTVTEVTDGAGAVLSASRFEPDFTIRVPFPTALSDGQEAQLTFTYSGQLKGYEGSPIEGIDVANLATDGGWLLYPARWFPVNGFEADQFKANIKVEVPAGYSVVGSGSGLRSEPPNGARFAFDFTHDSFPGSVGIVTGEPLSV